MSAEFFLKKTLGEDFLKSLQKFELYKPGTRTVVDHEEIKTALKIVPRTIMSFLIHHLTPMAIGETKETQLPISAEGAMLVVTKHERDVYSGDIIEANKKVSEFKNRSIPGVGLVIMTAFELYDTSKLIEAPSKAPDSDIESKLQKLVDERLAMHDLVGKVIEKKLEERDAVQKLIMRKLTEAIANYEKKLEQIDKSSLNSQMGNPFGSTDAPTPPPPPPAPEQTSGNSINSKIGFPFGKIEKGHQKLKKFIEQRKKPTEFNIEMAKGEHVDCPDCGKNIFNGTLFSGCICLGDDREKKIFIKKAEGGIKIRFGRGWDAENIEMLVEVLRRKRGQ